MSAALDEPDLLDECVESARGFLTAMLPRAEASKAAFAKLETDRTKMVQDTAISLCRVLATDALARFYALQVRILDGEEEAIRIAFGLLHLEQNKATSLWTGPRKSSSIWRGASGDRRRA